MYQKKEISLELTQKSIGELKMEKKSYSDSSLKVDKTCHIKNQDMGTMAKDAKLPGQMYVPKKPLNESTFSSEIKKS
jgi:hypothetical protein